MNKLIIITDSASDISNNNTISNVDVIAKRYRYLNDSNIYYDDFKDNLMKSSIIDFKINEEDIYQTLVNNYQKGITNFLVIVPSNSNYNEYLNAVNRFKEGYHVNVSINKSKLTSVSLLALINDLNEFIESGKDIEYLNNYIARSEQYYNMLIMTKNFSRLNLSGSEASIASMQLSGHRDIVLEKSINGYQVVKYKSVSEDVYRLILSNIKEKMEYNSPIVIGVGKRINDADHLGEMLYQELGNENIIMTQLSKEMINTSGEDAITLSYKR